MIASLRQVARLEPGERSRLWLSILLAFGTVVAAAGLLTAAGYLISRAAQRPDILALTAVITAVRGFALARAVLRYAERLVSHDLALRVLARLRAGFYAVLAPLGATALAGHRRGELLSRFVADVDSLQDLYLRALAPPVVAVLVIAAAGLTAWLILPAAGIALALCLLVAALTVPTLTAALAAAAGRRQAAARAELTNELVESLDGAVELAVAGRARERGDRLGALGERLIRIARRDALSGAVATGLASLAVGVTIIVLLLVGIPAVGDGSLSPVMLAAIVLLALGAFEGLAPLPLAARSLRGCAEAAGRLGELGSLRPAVSDPAAPVALAMDNPALEVERVAFRYADGTEPLRALSAGFAPGCRTLIQGSSGAGKTTLTQLLVRFLDPTAGTIRLGGVDLRELSLDDVRAHVTLAAQDAHVFTTTIRENLQLANRAAPEQRLWEALAAVRLDVWVRSLPDGLDTLVGEDGALLSGGQRQRLTIARALITDARFLILDEPTAQLDADTATELIGAAVDAAGDRGLIVISHRAEGIDRFDEVLRLDDGRLAPS